MFFFYMLRCNDGSLYCGSTSDLKKREEQHNIGKGSAYVRSRGGGKIVYSEKFKSRVEAMKREAQVKRLSKQKKEGLL